MKFTVLVTAAHFQKKIVIYDYKAKNKQLIQITNRNP